MAESSGNGEKEKEGKEEWDFTLKDIEKEDKKEKGPSKAQSNTGIRKLISKNKTADLKLAFDKVPKQVSRSNAEAYVNKDAHTTGKKDTSTPFLAERAKAFAIDGAVMGVFYMLSKSSFFLDFSFGLLEKIMDQGKLGAVPDNTYVDYALIAVNFTFFYFLVFVLLVTFTSKSPGKFACKILVDDMDGGEIGFLRTFFRELVFKPISILSVIGIFMPLMNSSRRSLHDVLAKTVVRKDYNRG